ncbi:MAG: glycosyltransferase [bacterium]
MDAKKVCEDRFKNEKEYLGNSKQVNKIEPLVSVTIATYQHKNFIEECLDGVLMQKTNFPIEIIIGEDGSTDGTREICIDYAEKHPDKIRLFLRDRKTSQYYDDNGNFVCRFNGIWNRMSVRGKYLAFCEGDDYWIDPLKLQKQVDFLENNLEYGLVITDFNIMHQSSGKIEESLFKNQPKKYPICKSLDEFLLAAGFMAPCTWVCRKEFLPVGISVDTTFTWLLDILATSKLHVLPDVTAVYRVLPESASHSSSLQKRYNRAKGLLKTQLDYIEKYKLSISIKEKVLQKYFKLVFPTLIALKQNNEITIAKNYLYPFTLKDRLLIAILKLPFNNYILRSIFWIRDKILKKVQ